MPGQLGKRRAKALGVKRYPLANRERSSLVIQSQSEELHGGWPCPTRYYRLATSQGS
jgi:hypothetical protein